MGQAVLWGFADGDGFDGVVFGIDGERVQLECITTPHHVIPRPTIEDALVCTSMIWTPTRS